MIIQLTSWTAYLQVRNRTKKIRHNFNQIVESNLNFNKNSIIVLQHFSNNIFMVFNYV